MNSSDSSKLESYKQICSDLFESFDRDVRMDSYHDLVQSMIEWQGEFLSQFMVIQYHFLEHYFTQDNLTNVVDRAVTLEIRMMERERERRAETDRQHYSIKHAPSSYNHRTHPY